MRKFGTETHSFTQREVIVYYGYGDSVFVGRMNMSYLNGKLPAIQVPYDLVRQKETDILSVIKSKDRDVPLYPLKWTINKFCLYNSMFVNYVFKRPFFWLLAYDFVMKLMRFPRTIKRVKRCNYFKFETYNCIWKSLLAIRGCTLLLDRTTLTNTKKNFFHNKCLYRSDLKSSQNSIYLFSYNPFCPNLSV